MGTILFSVGLEKLIICFGRMYYFNKKITFVNEEEILNLNIWNNNILINRTPVIYKNYFEKSVSDLDLNKLSSIFFPSVFFVDV